jgi:hypothetical protein
MDLGTIAGAANLESAINTIWANNAALVAVVPADGLITGRVPPSQKMPYVRLDPQGGQEEYRSNVSVYATERIAFHVWTDTVDAGRAIAPVIRDAFNSNEFNWTVGAVLDMKWDGPPETQQVTDPEIKAWQTTVHFTLKTWTQRQDTSAITSSSGD